MTDIEITLQEVNFETTHNILNIGLSSMGPVGPSGSEANRYTNTYSSSSTWVINHNLGHKPVISFYNTGSQEILASYTHTSENQATASFSTPTAGFVVAV
jgi:hypothetical protein